MSALLVERVQAWADRTPDAPALIGARQVVTHRQLRALVARAVMHLREQGIGAGDVVGIAISQTPLHPIVFLALGWIGALVVPVPQALRPQDRAEMVRKFALVAVVSEVAEVLPAPCRLVQLPGIGARGNEDMGEAGAAGFGPDTPLRLAVTSGTTGMPKATLQTHASFVDRMERMNCDVVDVPRVIPPALYITLAMNLAMHALCKGGAIVFPRSYDSRDLFEAIALHGVTHLAMPPANLSLVMRSINVIAPAFPGLRQLRLVGATPTRAILDEARLKISPHVYVPYGLGEIGLVSMATPAMLLDDPTTVGVLEPGVRLEFVDNAEVRVQIPGQVAGYYGPDAHLQDRFRDGWFHPGDRGRISATGMIHIDGRIDFLINLGGFKVSPEYVESVLMEHPGVHEAAVFAIDDGSGITRLVAAIIGAETLDWDALRVYSRQRLELTAPVRFLEVKSLPRNALGKLEREEISLASLAGAPERPG